MGLTLPSKEKLRILMLSHVRPGHAGTSHDHEYALSELSRHDVFIHDPVLNGTFADLDHFDAIIIHYSIVIWNKNYLPDTQINALKAYRGLKVLFIQDEYREVYCAIDHMLRIGIDVLFTCYQPYNIDRVYGELIRRGVRVLTTLTGYAPLQHVEESLIRPHRERTLDVVYRARPAWPALGRLHREKYTIAEEFALRASHTDLRCDIDWREERRIYSADWLKFIASSRTSLGVESGASIVDFTGEIHRAVFAFLAGRLPDSFSVDVTEEIDASVYSYLTTHPPASYEEVEREILKPYEGNVVLNVVSPRIFEAVHLKTTLVLFPGEYSKVIEKGRHYIALEKDFSNFAEVVDQLRDIDFVEAMAERAYRDLIETGLYSYDAFVREIDSVISEEWDHRVMRAMPARPTHFPEGLVETSASLSRELTRTEWREALRELRAAKAAEEAEIARLLAGVNDETLVNSETATDCLVETMQPESDPAALSDTSSVVPRRRPLGLQLLRVVLRLNKICFEKFSSKILGRDVRLHLHISPHPPESQ
ncbi:hypothetical protein [Microvirga puerhi]|uniref:Glycosyltransferase family 1 protein n=1 Tax=Microvirga puerhi TaxID=2876078 RepID=A0ABS7VNA7_9HYPH|nr:hypothetical protein [Microvirga puerhi]MBZ6076482.1 hypothetical protein [Microvirga puerhi]